MKYYEKKMEIFTACEKKKCTFLFGKALNNL